MDGRLAAKSYAACAPLGAAVAKHLPLHPTPEAPWRKEDE